jgi:hypothetical protein
MSITKVKVKLTGEDGNDFNILGRVQSAMRKAKVDQSIIDEYIKEATSGDYNHLLATTLKYVIVR